MAPKKETNFSLHLPQQPHQLEVVATLRLTVLRPSLTLHPVHELQI